ncbi:hypothetical protein MPSI1_002231 [Malassezia psittaci]|uniref:Amino acid transporter transmembrane domain-containing protein n=1 Tax=Malassezia psittaci TaxID=1821823 RepID=A0AAF0FF53_9BASI|nr:hypothetical protein MPSI1_002231 [Malassezia psittaci]
MPGRNAIPAYFGDNITTSPSFVERHWRGNIPEEQEDTESDATQQVGMESTTEDDASVENVESSDEDEANLTEGRVRDRTAPSLETRNFYPMMDSSQGLNDTQVPRLHTKSSSHADRGHHPRAFTKWSNSSTERDSKKAHNRRAAQAEFDEGTSDDQNDEEDDSSRSRSRSPKRIGNKIPQAQRPLMPYGKDRAPSRPPRDTSPYGARARSRSKYRTQLRAAAPHLRDPYHVDERAPLLRGWNAKQDYATPMQKSTTQSSADASVDLEADHGKSTFWQTWFNTVNVLVGVSILSMPLAFASVGWIGGFAIFVLCGWLTNYSGKVLARIMARDPHLQTYADIGSYVFGPTIRTGISFLFCFEMWMVSVALLILMSDSMTALLYGPEEGGHTAANAALKVLGVVVVSPTLFLPLRWLSPISLIGIISILFLFVVVITDGLVKRSAPGSLWQPGETTFALLWKRVPLAFGLVMAGFSSHPVIPSLYRDMRDPSQFDTMLDWAYLTTAAMYLVMATVGYLMFGATVSDEVTRDLAITPGYPRILTVAAVLLVTINPMTKFALALRPVTVVIEKWAGLLKEVLPATPTAQDEEGHQSFIQSMSGVQAMATGDSSGLNDTNASDPSSFQSRAKVSMIRLGMAFSVLVTAILVPSLERVMSFLGAFLTFNSCIFGPLLANLVLSRDQLSATVIWRDLLILGATFVLAMLGTLSAIVPKWFVN